MLYYSHIYHNDVPEIPHRQLAVRNSQMCSVHLWSPSSLYKSIWSVIPNAVRNRYLLDNKNLEMKFKTTSVNYISFLKKYTILARMQLGIFGALINQHGIIKLCNSLLTYCYDRVSSRRVCYAYNGCQPRGSAQAWREIKA